MKSFYALPTCLGQQKKAVGGLEGQEVLVSFKLGLVRVMESCLAVIAEDEAHQCFAQILPISHPQNWAGNSGCSDSLGTQKITGYTWYIK